MQLFKNDYCVHSDLGIYNNFNMKSKLISLSKIS